MADHDVIIVGSGLAGLTAGLFAARYGLSTLVLEANIPGGHLISIEKIEDFPGFPDGIPGYELCPNLQRQVADQGAAFSAQHAYQKGILGHSKIEVRYQNVVEEILGDDGVTGVRIRDAATAEKAQIDLGGVFVYVGLKPNTAFLKNTLHLSDTGHIPTDVWMRTERPGLYAVGDIRQDSPAQAITSAGEGATAAIAAYRYIKEIFRE